MSPPYPPSRSPPCPPSTQHKRKSPGLSPPRLGSPHPSPLSLPQPPLFLPATSQRHSLPLPYTLSQTLLLHLPQQLSVASDIFSLSLWLFLNYSCSKLALHFVIFSALCISFSLHSCFFSDIWLCLFFGYFFLHLLALYSHKTSLMHSNKFCCTK